VQAGQRQGRNGGGPAEARERSRVPDEFLCIFVLGGEWVAGGKATSAGHTQKAGICVEYIGICHGRKVAKCNMRKSVD
jgi:hypothetical protein